MIGSVNPLGLYFLLHIAEELKPSDCTARMLLLYENTFEEFKKFDFMLLLYENAFCERFFKVLKSC